MSNKSAAKTRALTALAALVGAAVGGFAAVQPAAAGHTYDYAPWVSERYTDSLDVQASLTPNPQIPLGAWRDADGKHHMSRVYATYDLSAFVGKKVFTANLYADEYEATDCVDRDVEVWTTSPATNPTWADPPAEQTLVGTVGGSKLCPGYIGMNMTSVVQQALAAGRTTVSVELRVPEDREGEIKLGRWLSAQYGVKLTVDYNTLPEVPTRLYNGGLPCATQAPYPYVASLRPTLAALFKDADPNDANDLTGTFAIWPADSPDHRTTFDDTNTLSSGWVSSVQVPAGVLAGDTTYGWQTRVSDGTDTSDWSQTCYFTTDATAPAQPPTVTSSNYPRDGYVSGGTPGHFTFASNGVDDVVGYQYSWNNYPGVICTMSYIDGVWQASDPLKTPGVVPADGLGGSATLDLSPPRPGPNRLYVLSIDRACNTSSVVEYDVTVGDTTPTILVYSQPMVGKPFTVSVRPNPAVTSVVSYRYQINWGDTRTVAASADGSGSVTFTPQCACSVSVEISSVSANGWVSPPAQYYYSIINAPAVSSDVYPDYAATWQSGGGIGVTSHFTFASPVAGTVGYQYSIDWGDTITVPAGVDGTATIEWTPDTSGVHEIEVCAVDADGDPISDEGYYDFYVTDPTP
ncbi:MAG TPA: hypothetical protein VF054_14460 [Micromonosporaceae bacterium]